MCGWVCVCLECSDLVFPHSNMVNRSAPLFSSLCSGHKMQTTNWKLIFLPFKTHMHFHLRGFMVVDLPGSGNGCLPADENHLLAHEVEVLQQEGKEHQSEYALFHFKRIKTIWICNKQNSVVFLPKLNY